MTKEYSWVNYIQRRTLKLNKNFIVSIIGSTGSGKSYSALSMGELIDPKFNISRVIFNALDLMDLINNGNLKSGSVLIWDEAGIGLSSKNWQSKLNKVINYLLQTFRHRNFVLIFTVPYASFIDVSSRRLFHAEFETVSINRSDNTCSIKPKQLQYNPGNDKWYKKYLKVIKPGEGIAKIKRWKVPKPSEELVQQYEIMKDKFTKELNKSIQDDLTPTDGRTPLTPFQEGIVNCWKEGIDMQIEIGKKLGSNKQKVSLNVQFMKRKGYTKEMYRKTQESIPNTTTAPPTTQLASINEKI